MAICFVISQIIRTFTMSKQNIMVKLFKSIGIVRKLFIGIVPPYRCCNGAIYHINHNVSFDNGKGNALFVCQGYESTF